MKPKIEILYQLWKEEDSKILNLTEEEYYDPLLPGDISYIKDGIAKYQEPHKYLTADADEIKWLVLKEPQENGYKIFRYQYFNGVDSFMIHAMWPDGTEEIINSVNINDKSCHITRTLKEPNSNWTTVLNVLTPHQAGDYSEEIHLSGLWTFEEKKAFGLI